MPACGQAYMLMVISIWALNRNGFCHVCPLGMSTISEYSLFLVFVMVVVHRPRQVGSGLQHLQGACQGLR